MFGKKSRKIAELENRLIDRTKEMRELSGKVAIFEAQEVREMPQLRQEIQDLQARLTSVKREQTEADLLFVSCKIAAEILQGKKTADIQPLIDQQSLLRQQLIGGMQQQYNVGGDRALPGFLGGLGSFLLPGRNPASR